ncbi:MAG: hypothetical protein M3144_09050 [Actinomycetota bacterium]|nr:hypothetical protein [Actinomycetota bacterium]
MSVVRGGSVRKAAGTALALGVAAAVLLTGCAGSGYTYVQSSANKTYFKVPEEWRVYNKDQVLGLDRRRPSQEADPGLRYLAVFDADPNPSLEHDLQTATSPFGVVKVRQLSPEERDTFSLQSLRNEVVPIDDILEQEVGQIQLIKEPESIVKGGLRGSRLVYTVLTDNGSFAVDQTGLVDAGTNTLYFFIVGCESECFAANRRTISEVADSWTIKER